MIDVEEKVEPITKPPERWRNKWFIPWRCVDRLTGRVTIGPTVTCSDEAFPSKDLAETVANEVSPKWSAYPREVWPRYLGAVPDEDAI